MKDVAVTAGVAVGTVSNVLNRPERVKPSTVAHVRRVMADLGYVRNETARQLRVGRSWAMAYVFPDASNPFFMDVARGIDQVLEDEGVSLLLSSSDNRSNREAAHLERLSRHRVDGILLTPLDVDSLRLDENNRLGTPLVLVGSNYSEDVLCSVAVDDVLGGWLAVEHLVDLGHRRVAVVAGPQKMNEVVDRIRGAREAWHSLGLPSDGLTVIESESMTVDGGRQAGARWLGVPSRTRSTAAFCTNDLMAIGLLQQVTQAGVVVPAELAIVGYDDIEFASAAAVPLTSVRQPRHRLGIAAAQLLLDESTQRDHAHRQLTFEPELIARASSSVSS